MSPLTRARVQIMQKDKQVETTLAVKIHHGVILQQTFSGILRFHH